MNPRRFIVAQSVHVDDLHNLFQIDEQRLLLLRAIPPRREKNVVAIGSKQAPAAVLAPRCMAKGSGLPSDDYGALGHVRFQAFHHR